MADVSRKTVGTTNRRPLTRRHGAVPWVGKVRMTGRITV